MRRNSTEAEHVKLIEQKLHVRRHVVGDENQRRVGCGVVPDARVGQGRMPNPMLNVHARSLIPMPASRCACSTVMSVRTRPPPNVVPMPPVRLFSVTLLFVGAIA